MRLNVPYSLVPGSKARAEELNANFNSILEDISDLSENLLYKDLSNLTSTGLDYIKNSVSSRNLGELIFSPIPIIDTCVRLLDGSIVENDSIHSGFVDYIAGLYNSTPEANYFTTEEDWQDTVTQYGTCAKFVYDPQEETVRLPKICGIIEATNTLSELGSITEAGLPNIQGYLGQKVAYGNPTGAFYQGNVVGSFANGGSSYGVVDSYFDASRSSSLYGSSNTVQPQTIKQFVYIVVATSFKTDVQIGLNDIMASFDNKLNADYSNSTKPYVTESYTYGISSYRVWSDGRCEQCGATRSGNTLTFLKPFKDDNYIITAVPQATGNTVNNQGICATEKTSTSIKLSCAASWGMVWYANGSVE